MNSTVCCLRLDCLLVGLALSCPSNILSRHCVHDASVLLSVCMCVCMRVCAWLHVEVWRVTVHSVPVCMFVCVCIVDVALVMCSLCCVCVCMYCTIVEWFGSSRLC